MPHRYSRSTRSASQMRKISPTLARLRTSSSTTLIGARGRLANRSGAGLRATSSAVVSAGHSGEGGGGRSGFRGRSKVPGSMLVPVTTTVNLRELQAPIKTRYQEQPEAARISLRVKSALSDLADPLHCAITPEAAPDVTWRSGAHPGVGGTGDVPCS